jgi:hypothetical protein
MSAKVRGDQAAIKVLPDRRLHAALRDAHLPIVAEPDRAVHTP